MNYHDVLDIINETKEIREPRGTKTYILYANDTAYSICFENGQIEVNNEYIETNVYQYDDILYSIEDKIKELKEKED